MWYCFKCYSSGVWTCQDPGAAPPRAFPFRRCAAHRRWQPGKDPWHSFQGQMQKTYCAFQDKKHKKTSSKGVSQSKQQQKVSTSKTVNNNPHQLYQQQIASTKLADGFLGQAFICATMGCVGGLIIGLVTESLRCKALLAQLTYFFQKASHHVNIQWFNHCSIIVQWSFNDSGINFESLGFEVLHFSQFHPHPWVGLCLQVRHCCQHYPGSHGKERIAGRWYGGTVHGCTWYCKIMKDHNIESLIESNGV